MTRDSAFESGGDADSAAPVSFIYSVYLCKHLLTLGVCLVCSLLLKQHGRWLGGFPVFDQYLRYFLYANCIYFLKCCSEVDDYVGVQNAVDSVMTTTSKGDMETKNRLRCKYGFFQNQRSFCVQFCYHFCCTSITEVYWSGK